MPDFAAYYERYMKREVNKTELARELHISRPTLDKLIQEQQCLEEKAQTEEANNKRHGEQR